MEYKKTDKHRTYYVVDVTENNGDFQYSERFLTWTEQGEELDDLLFSIHMDWRGIDPVNQEVYWWDEATLDGYWSDCCLVMRPRIISSEVPDDEVVILKKHMTNWRPYEVYNFREYKETMKG